MIRSLKNNISYWKVALCALLLPATFFLVSCQDQLGPSDSVSSGIFAKVDEAAIPQGGLNEFYQHIKKNIRYPAESRANHKYGKIFVQFVVNEDGSLSDIEILGDADPILAKEAMRTVALSPEWRPARLNGERVRQQFVLPIDFKLDIPDKGIHSKNNNSAPGEVTPLAEIVVVGYASKALRVRFDNGTTFVGRAN